MHKIKHVGFGMITYVECACGHRAPYGAYRDASLAESGEGIDFSAWVCPKDPAFTPPIIGRARIGLTAFQFNTRAFRVEDLHPEVDLDIQGFLTVDITDASRIIPSGIRKVQLRATLPPGTTIRTIK